MNIKEIYIGSYKRNNYLVINEKENTFVFNINKGKEESNLNLTLTDITDIYSDTGEYKEKIDLNKIIKIELISNVELLNKYTRKNISSPFLLCLTDKDNKKLYIDIVYNIIYSRKNHYILKRFSNTKYRSLYCENNPSKIFYSKLIIKLSKKLLAFCEIEEDVV